MYLHTIEYKSMCTYLIVHNRMSPSAAPDSNCMPLLANLTVSTEAVCPNINTQTYYLQYNKIYDVDNTHHLNVCTHSVFLYIQKIIHIHYGCM
jgi:hypothetical protein